MPSIASFTITDADGDTKSVPIYFEVGTISQEDIEAAMQTMAADMDAVIDGKITAMHLTLEVALPGGLKASPVANSEVEKGALLTFDASSTPYNHSIFVPSWTPSKFSGDNVNAGAAGVATFLGDITTGITETSGGFLPTDRYSNDLVTYLKGLKRFRK